MTKFINLLKKYSKVSSPESLYLPLSGTYSSSRFLKFYDSFKSLFKVKQLAKLDGLFD
jgi:hypothetical protein